MDKLKRVVVKEEYVKITNNLLEAILLNQMIYWSERIKDFDKFIEEENDRIKKNSIDGENDRIELNNGWIYKKASELKEELMDIASEKTINRKLDNLIEKKYLERRRNPKFRYDRTYQYRLNFLQIIKELSKQGYTLQNYKIDFEFYNEVLKNNNRQNVQSNPHSDDSNVQIDDLKRQIDDLKKQNDDLKAHNDGTIPEITTEITTESTNKGEIKDPTLNLSDQFKSLIKEHVTEVTFKTWFSSIDTLIKDNLLVITVSSEFMRDILESKYQTLILKTIKVIDSRIEKISFVIKERK